LAKLGPSGKDRASTRILFLKSSQIKARLADAVSLDSRPRVLAAPVLAIVGNGRESHVQQNSSGDRAERRVAALRDSALQGANLIMAARALGLDCGPVWTLDDKMLGALLFADAQIEPNFLCAIGYADDAPESLRPAPLSFDEACRIL
jgi:3-hydroxypropanoate dehydrogenase